MSDIASRNPVAERVRLSVDVSPELNELLERISNEADTSKSEVIRRAIVLMDLAVEAVKDGGRVLIDEGKDGTKEVVGLLGPGVRS